MDKGEISPRTSWRRGVLAAGCLGLSGLAMLLGWWMNPAPSKPALPGAPTAPNGLREATVGPRAASPTAEPPQVQPIQEDPALARVYLQKSEVCSGEQNLLRVELGEKAAKETRIFIDGQVGPARIYAPTTTEEREITPSITLVTTSGTPIKAPSFKVKPCKPLIFVKVEHSPVPNSLDVIQFSVRVVGRPEAPFEPVSYRWSFGDGASARSDKGHIEHDYGRRPQSKPTSDLLIRVEISGKDGRQIEAFDTLSLTNEAFHSIKQGVVQILSDATPRFPEEDAQGNVKQTIKLWHVHDRPVQIAAVTIEESEDQKLHRRVVKAGSLLPSTLLRPGQVIELPVQLGKDSPYRVVHYQVHGKSEDGKLASGDFFVQRPTARPTPEDHSPVDARTAMRIRMAQKILGKPFVSDGDMDRLEAQGAFRKLEARPD
jgi:hypothetical protein